jgi:hypothetical protein
MELNSAASSPLREQPPALKLPFHGDSDSTRSSQASAKACRIAELRLYFEGQYHIALSAIFSWAKLRSNVLALISSPCTGVYNDLHRECTSLLLVDVMTIISGGRIDTLTFLFLAIA